MAYFFNNESWELYLLQYNIHVLYIQFCLNESGQFKGETQMFATYVYVGKIVETLLRHLNKIFI